MLQSRALEWGQESARSLRLLLNSVCRTDVFDAAAFGVQRTIEREGMCEEDYIFDCVRS